MHIYLCLDSSAKTGVLKEIRLTHCGLLSAQTARGCKRIPTTEKVQVRTQCLDRTRARKGGSQQTFRHSTGNGWALGSMSPIRCSKKQEELLKVLCALSVLCNRDRAIAARPPPNPQLFAVCGSTQNPPPPSSGKQIVSFNKQYPWDCLGWGRARLVPRLSSAQRLGRLSPRW